MTLKFSALIVAAALVLVGAGLPAGADETAMSNKDIVGLVGNSVFNDHDFGPIDQYIREDYIQHNPLVGQGREGFREFFQATFAAIPDWRYDLINIAAEGDYVWVYGTYSGTQSGEWLGIPATDKSFSITAVDIFRLQEGQLAEHWDVMDIYGLFTQLGVIQ